MHYKAFSKKITCLNCTGGNYYRLQLNAYSQNLSINHTKFRMYYVKNSVLFHDILSITDVNSQSTIL